MKLIVAIVQNEDAYILTDSLRDNDFSVTKLATTGGFLKINNVTLMVGCEKERVDEAIKIIGKICKSRDQVVSTPLPSSYTESAFASYSVNVKVGGATVFVLDVDQFIKF